ncbi:MULTISPECIES: transcription-repair coupling factor [unclassified Leucobacter]|uniref:transcription-repair coupling factor n=1 Tax=unclassified Leucobacter TaxID=2621730 RepID=UPI00165E3131|nr:MULTISPECIES: transcription-repair coupling factor [unclassified Leucobacter]MBC9926059.1 transcription-repair coupling factor [Leucobacter sp. cx-169]MBC9935714.1 transcription-repair coupling factor [Leucobacter sp. cx-87]
MSLAGIERALESSESFARALDQSAGDADFSVDEGLRAPLIAGLIGRRRLAGDTGPLLVVAATSREADALREALGSILPDAATVEFPAWETLPHERLSPSAETVGRRSAALRMLREHDGTAAPLLMVASVRAVLQPVSPQVAHDRRIVLRAGASSIGLESISRELVDLAYTRVDMVTRRGEFAVRGGILDVFSPTAEQAVRIDFFGDDVDDIRRFSVGDQRSAGDAVPEIVLPPARELLLTDAVRERAAALIPQLPTIAGMLEKISQGIAVEGMESLIPQLVPGLAPLTGLLPEGGAVVVLSPERVAMRAVHLAEANREFLEAAWGAATAGAQSPIPVDDSGLLTMAEVRAASRQRPWWTLSKFVRDEEADALASAGPARQVGAQAGSADPAPAGVAEADGAASDADSNFEGITDDTVAEAHGYVVVRGGAVPSPPARSEPAQAAIEHIAARLAEGWRTVVTAQGAGLVERARDLIAEAGLAARIVDRVPEEFEPGVAYVTTGTAWVGFESPEARLVLASEAEFFGRAVSGQAGRPTKLAKRRGRNVVDPLQLIPGDHVVHEAHGIGRFVELTQRLVPNGIGKGATKSLREYLVIEYASTKRGMPSDKLYVPTDQLDQLSRYVGGESPPLSKMGGSDWANAKKKARSAVRDIAVELVKLYSARMASRGHAFSPDTPWQHELEEAFPYAETIDQLTTIDEVKKDMESPVPMDRLVSGDVGFGKTEIAIRAAFKAVQDGKQVAVLVPTTLLVKQHMETFQSRFAGFPVQLRALSRFQTEKESRETLDGLAAGTVDVVIGTHRLLTDSVRYRDLGLLVVDEEQRFGVEHKDSLKKLKTNVDILAMSATPIPRTLEMAVTGIREMSTLATAPEDRHPILTFVGPRSDKQISAAIRREMLREGQVFFVHNRVSSINRIAAQLAELVPDARIAVAHGKMNEHQLEQVVVDFYERKYDVLVSTTIVETGLDIANANTIIIDQADRYGLSQLHQLRGRVGRSRERAYAYFLYDADKVLTETAHERLETIATNNELGAGMQVALKDLELRGAGNLLGGQQSGHIAGVGFDLYLRMIGEAVSTFKGEDVSGSNELVLELPVDAHIPEHYVESERLRLEAYQKFSAASHPHAPEDHVSLVLEELTDRYGAPPEEVTRLAEVSALRRRASRLGLSKVVAAGPSLRLEPVSLPESRVMRLSRMYPGSKVVSPSVISIPLPAVLAGRGPGSSPLAGVGLRRGPASAEDGDVVAWVGRVFETILEEPAPAAAPTA